MGLPKGKTNNPNGRPKGKPNKTTSELREIILQFVSENWGQVQEDFNKLEPKQRLAFMEKMLNYAVPKMQSQSIEIANPIDKEIDKLSDEQADKVLEMVLNQSKNELKRTA